MSTLVIGFTGTQEGLTQPQRDVLFTQLRLIDTKSSALTIVGKHGDCWGADAEFSAMCRALKFETHAHPGHDANGLSPKRANCEATKRFPSEPYLYRNRVIVDNSAVLIGCPKTMVEERRSGTWTTIRYAEHMEKTNAIIFPDGTIKIRQWPPKEWDATVEVEWLNN